MDLCSSKRVCLEIGDAFIIEKYQDYITELATFKNTDLRSAFCINVNWVSQHFANNSKYSLVTSEMYFKTMLIHPLKTFHGGKKSMLALRLTFEVMVEKQNLILLRGKRNLICKLKCVNHKHKWRCSSPPLEIAPSPLLTAPHLGSDDPI